jgi:hypothetical protein
MALTQVDQGLLGQYAQYTGFKNRIINGAMVIDQRNAGAVYNTTTLASADFYSLDRWIVTGTQNSKFTVQGTPSTTETGYATRVNAGFLNYLACTSSSAYSVGSGDLFAIGQYIEGFNTADFAWGTSNAKTITISFLVYSSLTGTFGGVLKNSANNYSYPFSYSISSANTWTQISVTVAGPTSGTWIGATNGVGLRVYFGLGVGSTYSGTAGAWAAANYFAPTGATSVVGTNSATFYITGVQLEKGSTATSFDYRPYGTELALCQRYYQTYTNLPTPYNANGNNGLNGWLSFVYPVPMRSAPTASGSSVSYKQSAGSITVTSVVGISTNAGFLDQFFGAAATNPGYSVPTIVYFGTLSLSAEL